MLADDGCSGSSAIGAFIVAPADNPKANLTSILKSGEAAPIANGAY
jgi:hypothetical protein